MSVRSQFLTAGICVIAAGLSVPLFLTQAQSEADQISIGPVSSPLQADNNARRDLHQLAQAMDSAHASTGHYPTSATNLAHDVDFHADLASRVSIAVGGQGYCLVGTNRLGTKTSSQNILGTSTRVLYLDSASGKVSDEATGNCQGSLAVDGFFTSAGLQQS